MRRCVDCQVVKLLEEFHRKKAGYQSRCKPCANAYTQAYRQAHLADVRAADRARADRAKTPEARNSRNAWQRARFRADPEKVRASVRATPSYGRQYGKATNQAHVAHERVRRALKSGRLIKPSVCSRCGEATSRIEAAHHDYSRPYDVTWLCASCHRYEDAHAPKGGTVKLR